MKIGDLLLLKGVINKKQLTSALSKQAEEAINYSRSVPLGKILIEMGHVSVDEISDALNEQSQEVREEIKKKEKPVATEINEESKFTFDLKFIITLVTILISACGTYFSITGQINELKANNSPNRLEYEYVVKEIENIKSMGDLKIITYQLEEFKTTFTEIKQLAGTLSPLAADLTYIKKVSKSNEAKLDALVKEINELQKVSKSNEERLNTLEKRNSGGSRF